jgi:dCMP deaminase
VLLVWKIEAGERKVMSNELRWHFHFLKIAEDCASMSKDPSTKVGAVIVGPDREVRSTGFNGLPRGIADTDERLNDRDTKLKLVVHAEMNAILNAARFGIPLKGCTLYLAAMNNTGLVWGGPPCTRCSVETIQSGIRTIVSYPKKAIPSRWHDDLAVAQSILEEGGIDYREVPNRNKDCEYLVPRFMEMMDDIGRYGFEKYKDASFHALRMHGDRSRDDRLAPQAISDHIKDHVSMYLRGEKHDKFGTKGHQLAAVAFNAMMEFYFASLDSEDV